MHPSPATEVNGFVVVRLSCQLENLKRANLAPAVKRSASPSFNPADDHQIRSLFQRQTDESPKRLVIIDDENPDW
jgi:hypothetical protein